uniref:Reverse transcriptase domain-containing protein n=1 Tax=Amaranthus palmeri TaxID=107608 RepID=A0A6C0T528_AMAPA|nr:hypothetical protein AP_R.00g000460-v1.0.a3 [Amaranthus palmeri]
MHIVFVYGLHTVTDRRDLWEGLMKLNYNSACLYLGYFNAIYKDEHRMNGTQVNTYETGDMQNWLDQKELHPLPERGHQFSWTNKEEGENRILTKIDHAIGNIQWLSRYNQVGVLYDNHQSSDHTLLIVNLLEHGQKQNTPFRFFNYLCDHKDFLKVVDEAWQIEVRGDGLQKLWHKMKNVKRGLKQLHNKDFAGVKDKIMHWEQQLQKTQTDLQSNPTSEELHHREKEISSIVHKWRKIEDKALHQKARITWMRNGDDNTAYFHAAIKERISSNSIHELQDRDGNWISKSQEIHNEITQFYKGLQGTATPNLEGIDSRVMREGLQVDSRSRLDLIRDVEEEEIKNALFGMNDNKAPGIDGFNACFFKRTWAIIKGDFINAIKGFFRSNYLFAPYNCTAVTLIPKTSNANRVGDFRPIACCTVIYKVISRVLAGRLQMVMGSIIDQAQSGFIPGRQMADNILLAAELIKGYNRKNNSPRCMIKMDLRKAYDSISWEFLFSVISEMGFPPRFVEWIKV